MARLDCACETRNNSWMVRKSQPDRPRLEKLLDDRDHLRIRLNLAEHSELPDENQIKNFRLKLSDLESRIRLYQP